MPYVLTWMREYQGLLEGLAGLSLLMFVVTLVVFPLVIIYLPEDYFVRDRRDPARQTRRHPAVWLVLTVLKNVLGVILVVAGAAMLVLPGQGLLTMLLGVTLVNFPGKFALERRIVSRPSVANTLNRIRESAGRARLELPGSEDL